MTANTGGKGHMAGKSLFEKAQAALGEGNHSTAETPTPKPFTNPRDAELVQAEPCFELNANRSDDRHPIGPRTLEPGSGVTCRSPLFGSFDAMVIRGLGKCVWIWHPIRECEACVPRSWITEIVQPFPERRNNSGL